MVTKCQHNQMKRKSYYGVHDVFLWCFLCIDILLFEQEVTPDILIK